MSVHKCVYPGLQNRVGVVPILISTAFGDLNQTVSANILQGYSFYNNYIEIHPTRYMY